MASPKVDFFEKVDFFRVLHGVFSEKSRLFVKKSNYRVIGVILVGKRRFYAVNDKQKCEFIVPSQMVIEASRWRKVAALLQLYSYTEQQY